MTFTPGPWIFEPHGGYGSKFDDMHFPFGYISAGVGRPIFELDTITKYDARELVANALLIAAAPEMLAALKHLYEHLHLNPTGQPGWNASLNMAEAAIAKATGESHD